METLTRTSVPQGPTARSRKTRPHRAYRAAFFASLALNVVLIGAIALYLHFAALLGAVEGAVGFLG